MNFIKIMNRPEYFTTYVICSSEMLCKNVNVTFLTVNMFHAYFSVKDIVGFIVLVLAISEID